MSEDDLENGIETNIIVLLDFYRHNEEIKPIGNTRSWVSSFEFAIDDLKKISEDDKVNADFASSNNKNIIVSNFFEKFWSLGSFDSFSVRGSLRRRSCKGRPGWCVGGGRYYPKSSRSWTEEPSKKASAEKEDLICFVLPVKTPEGTLGAWDFSVRSTNRVCPGGRRSWSNCCCSWQR